MVISLNTYSRYLPHQDWKNSRVCHIAHTKNYSSWFSNKVSNTFLQFVMQSSCAFRKDRNEQTQLDIGKKQIKSCFGGKTFKINILTPIHSGAAGTWRIFMQRLNYTWCAVFICSSKAKIVV